MKRILLLCVFTCVLAFAKAQRVYFIYLQSEKSTPFYVKMGDKVLSSTAEGYLILSKLVDSTYNFTIGSPGRGTSEARFAITVNKGDKGFLIREADNTLSLFDLQSMAVIKALAGNETAGTVGKRTDGFTKLLSQAVDDSSLLNIRTVPIKTAKPMDEAVATPIAKAEAAPAASQQKDTVAASTVTEQPVARQEAVAAKQDTVATKQAAEVAKLDTAVTTKENEDIGVTKKKEDVITTKEKEDIAAPPQQEVSKEAPVQTETKEEAAPQEVYKRSVVTRRSESSTSEGFGLVYLDKRDGGTDTIRLLIPNTNRLVTEASVPVAEEKEMPSAVTEVKTEKIDNNKGAVVTLPSSCTSLASENDFLKLRKNMAAKSNEYAMIMEAQKVFRGKCFTTDQVKNLSALFLTDEGKYGFFDAAYKHVTDPAQFAGLGAEIKDYYYTNRFKALIGK